MLFAIGIHEKLYRRSESAFELIQVNTRRIYAYGSAEVNESWVETTPFFLCCAKLFVRQKNVVLVSWIAVFHIQVLIHLLNEVVWIHVLVNLERLDGAAALGAEVGASIFVGKYLLVSFADGVSAAMSVGLDSLGLLALNEWTDMNGIRDSHLRFLSWVIRQNKPGRSASHHWVSRTSRHRHVITPICVESYL